MKANELMVGDYVMCQSIKEKYARITEIYLTLDEKPKRMVALNARGARYCVLIGSVEPILLKRIHLTKNGFRATNAEDTEFVYRDGYEVKVMIEEDLVDAIFLSIEFAERNMWKEIEYVNELQQAMRIMGCDKEIEL